MAHQTPDTLAEYVAPMKTANKATIYLQLADDPEAQQAVQATLPDEADNDYYQTLFDHVKNGAELTPSDAWLQKPRPLTTWEKLEEERTKDIAEAQANTADTSLSIGPHGDHRSRDYDIVTASLWMVCRKISAVKKWPIVTHPERIADALHLASYVEYSSNYTRVATSLGGALARCEDEEHWHEVHDIANGYFKDMALGDENFRTLTQPWRLHFAMKNKDYQQVVDSEREVYPLRARELSHFSLAALCAVIEQSRN